MGIFITKDKLITKDFTKTPNSILESKFLSPTTKLIFSIILSLPKPWSLNLKNIKEKANVGLYSVKKAFAELRHYGYLTYKRLRDAKGQFNNIEYDINFDVFAKFKENNLNIESEKKENFDKNLLPSTKKYNRNNPILNNENSHFSLSETSSDRLSYPQVGFSTTRTNHNIENLYDINKTQLKNNINNNKNIQSNHLDQIPDLEAKSQIQTQENMNVDVFDKNFEDKKNDSNALQNTSLSNFANFKSLLPSISKYTKQNEKIEKQLVYSGSNKIVETVETSKLQLKENLNVKLDKSKLSELEEKLKSFNDDEFNVFNKIKALNIGYDLNRAFNIIKNKTYELTEIDKQASAWTSRNTEKIPNKAGYFETLIKNKADIPQVKIDESTPKESKSDAIGYKNMLFRIAKAFCLPNAYESDILELFADSYLIKNHKSFYQRNLQKVKDAVQFQKEKYGVPNSFMNAYNQFLTIVEG